MPNHLLLIVAIVSVAVGGVCGGCVVCLLFAARKRILANSLAHNHSLIGHLGTVQIPFDSNSKGTITIAANHATKELVALTEYPNSFSQGDRVVVVQMQKSHAWVVAEKALYS